MHEIITAPFVSDLLDRYRVEMQAVPPSPITIWTNGSLVAEKNNSNGELSVHSVEYFMAQCAGADLLTPREEVNLAQQVELGKAASLILSNYGILRPFSSSLTIITARETLEKLGLSESYFPVIIEEKKKKPLDDASTDAKEKRIPEVDRFERIDQDDSLPLADTVLLEYCVSKAENAKNVMIMANVRLAARDARKIYERQRDRFDFRDLTHNGILGLIRAVEKFQWRLDLKFSTSAVWWIKQSITRRNIYDEEPIAISVEVDEVRGRVVKAVSKALSQGKGVPSASEIALGIGASLEMVNDVLWLLRIGKPARLYAVRSGTDRLTLADITRDPNTDVHLENEGTVTERVRAVFELAVEQGIVTREEMIILERIYIHRELIPTIAAEQGISKSGMSARLRKIKQRLSAFIRSQPEFGENPMIFED